MRCVVVGAVALWLHASYAALYSAIDAVQCWLHTRIHPLGVIGTRTCTTTARRPLLARIGLAAAPSCCFIERVPVKAENALIAAADL